MFYLLLILNFCIDWFCSQYLFENCILILHFISIFEFISLFTPEILGVIEAEQSKYKKVI